MADDEALPQYSPDGRYWWNGEQWVPTNPPPSAPPAANRRGGLSLGALVGIICAVGLVVVVIGTALGNRSGPDTSSQGSSYGATFDHSPNPAPPPPPSRAMAASGKNVTIDYAVKVSPGQSSLGDPEDNVTIDVVSNVPASPVLFHLFVTTHRPGGNLNLTSGSCDTDSSCRLVDGKFHAEGFCAPYCGTPRTIEVLICSWNGDPFAAGGTRCGGQADDYLTWVGNLGANLNGNPLAVHDDQHPNVLDLDKQSGF